MQKKLIIAHLSDLHLGNEEGRVIEGNLLQSLSNVRPDFIIISGDISDDVRVKKEQVDNFFNKLRELTPREIVTVPGNHDLKWRGIIKTHCRDFKEYDSIVFDEHEIIVFAFNSALKGIFAGGEISNDTLRKFEEDVREKVCQHRRWNYLKIAVLHHHPLPVPFSSTVEFYEHKLKWYDRVKYISRRIKDYEGFLLLNKSENFLYSMLNAGIDIVLHGHRHVRAFNKWPYINESGRVVGDIFVAAPGSPFVPNPQRPFSFNVITVEPDKSTKIIRYETEHSLNPFSPKGDPILVIGEEELKSRYEDLKSKHYQWAREESNIWCERLVHEEKISEVGDCETKESVKLEQDCTAKEYPIKGELYPGQFSQIEPPLKVEPPTVSWEGDKEKSSHSYLEGSILFGSEREFSCQINEFTCFAMNTQEAAGLHYEPKNYELVGVYIAFPISELEVRVELPETLRLEKEDVRLFIYECKEISEKLETPPEKFPPDSLRDFIKYDADKRLLISRGPMREKDRDELLRLWPESNYQKTIKRLFQRSRQENRRYKWEEFERKNLTYDEDKRKIVLKVSRPFCQRLYEINWNIPSVPSVPEESKVAYLIRERLLSWTSVREKLRDSLSRIRDEIIKMEKAEEETIEDIMLMVFDERKKKIVVSSCLFDVNNDIWKLELPPGIGLVWWVMKNKRMDYFDRGDPKTLHEIYLEPSTLRKLNPELNLNLEPHEVLISWPLVLGQEAVGVLNTGSTKRGSVLKSLALKCKSSVEERKKVTENLIAPLLVDIVEYCRVKEMLI